MSAGASNDHSGAGDRGVDARRLLQLVRAEDLDAAIDAGLAAFTSSATLDDDANAELAAVRDRLLVAWAARERYNARSARLARRAAERKAARVASPSPDASPAALPADGARLASPPALPAAASAALARARARMAGKP